MARRSVLAGLRPIRSLFSQHPDGVFEIGLDGRLVDCNQAAEVIAGYGRDQLIGEHYSKVLLPEFYNVASNALILMARGESHSYEIVGLNASGQAIFLDIINLPIVVDGEITGGYGIARDISERKKAEDRMRLLERGIEASPNGVVMLDARVMRPALQTEAEVKALAGRMLICLAEAYDIEGQRLSISASIGIASDDGSVEQPKELLDNAALAAREAKRQGGNTFCWNHGAASTTGAEQVIMRRELMEAIEACEFVVHYQPLVAAKTGRLRSAEALVRWNHPARGLLLPEAFISLAEQTGQIVAIGRWVLHQACMDMAQRWRQTGQAVSIAVNISPLQFRRLEFIEDVFAVLDASDCDLLQGFLYSRPVPVGEFALGLEY